MTEDESLLRWGQAAAPLTMSVIACYPASPTDMKLCCPAPLETTGKLIWPAPVRCGAASKRTARFARAQRAVKERGIHDRFVGREALTLQEPTTRPRSNWTERAPIESMVTFVTAGQPMNC